MGGPTHIRWERAARLVGVGAAVVIAVAVAPSLLQPQRPPPLDPDIGLTGPLARTRARAAVAHPGRPAGGGRREASHRSRPWGTIAGVRFAPEGEGGHRVGESPAERSKPVDPASADPVPGLNPTVLRTAQPVPASPAAASPVPGAPARGGVVGGETGGGPPEFGFER